MNNQINSIIDSMESMLHELTQDEINIIEDFIVNHCEDSTDQDNSTNFFRKVFLDEI